MNTKPPTPPPSIPMTAQGREAHKGGYDVCLGARIKLTLALLGICLLSVAMTWAVFAGFWQVVLLIPISLLVAIWLV